MYLVHFINFPKYQNKFLYIDQYSHLCAIYLGCRSNSLGGMARMDMEIHGVGGNSNDSDDIGSSGGAMRKILPKL